MKDQHHTASSRSELLTGSILLLVLALTRSGIARSHFGDHVSLPDMSWAMFWLAGAFTTRRLWPVLMMLVSVAIDYWVIAHGVSAYCFTPAYPFLIPAYGALWLSGRRCAACRSLQSLQQIAAIAVSLLIGVTACFAIANLGFYLASGYFAGMPFPAFVRAVLRHWPAYLMHTTLTAAMGLLLARGLRMLRTTDEATPFTP